METAQGGVNQHLARTHKIRNLVSLKLGGITCLHCLQKLHNLTRLKGHLRDTQYRGKLRCHEYYMTYVDNVSLELHEKLEEPERQRIREASRQRGP